MTRLVLASRSAARAALLTAAGVAFEASPGAVDEGVLKRSALQRGATPFEVAGELAAAKALASAHDALVLGADQTLDLEGRLFDKPEDLDAARGQLLALRGRTHRLHSAAALAFQGAIVWSHIGTATLTVRPFSGAFLDAYLEEEGAALLHCVGGYRLEGRGAQLFSAVEGDYFTVLGLPLFALLEALRERGVLPS